MSKRSRFTSKAVRLANTAIADYAVESLHRLRVPLDRSYRDRLDLLSDIARILWKFGLSEADLSHHSTVVNAIGRVRPATYSRRSVPAITRSLS